MSGRALARASSRAATSRAGSGSLGASSRSRGQTYEDLATDPRHASATMTHAVQGFNEQLEKLAELPLVLLVGAMLPYATSASAVWWFIPVMFFVLRPAAVLAGTVGQPMRKHQRAMICWFGIRGIGSVYYLLFAIRHGVPAPLADQLITLTLVTVAVSIVAHGVSAQPLVRQYMRRKAAAA